MNEGTGPAGARSFDRTQIELFSSSEMVAALLESAAQAILSVSPSGDIVLANRRAEEMFGYSREELLSMKVEGLLPKALGPSHVQHRSRYFASPHTRPMGIGMDLMARRKDGTEFAVEVSLSQVQAEGASFAIAFVSDISQRKQLEEGARNIRPALETKLASATAILLSCQ